MVYICQSQPPNSSHPPFHPWCLYVCSLYLCLYFCFVNKIVYYRFFPIYMCSYACTSACSVVSNFATPWTVAPQALLSMEFFKQEYRSGLPFSTPGDLPNLGSNSSLLHLLHWQANSLALCHLGSYIVHIHYLFFSF